MTAARATLPQGATDPSRHRVTSAPRGSRLTATSSVGLGVAVIWFSLLVLLPIAAIVAKTTAGGWSDFWQTISNPAVSAALRLTILTSLAVTVLNSVMGTLIAWVLVRDRFRGQRLLETIIDVPFALPTIVAGLVLISLYGPNSPLNIAQTKWAIFVALLFVTVPFVVRTVQPVLAELDVEAEQAAASLGAGPATVFRRIVLPNLAPAIGAGAALTFARALGEYGAVVLISGNLPFKTEVASVRIMSQIENDDLAGAASTALILLMASLLVIVLLQLVQRWTARRA